MNYLISIFTVIILSAPAHSFINIESLRQTNEIGYQGSVGLRVSGEIGNAGKFGGQFTTLDGHITEKREIIVLADYSYGESLSEKDANNGRLHLRHTRNYDDSPDIETFVQAQFDEFTRMRLRTLAGSGLRFELIKEDHKFLYLGTGFFYEKQERKNASNKSGVRANLYISYLYKTGKNFEASITSYIQPYIDRPSDFWINSVQGIEYFLSEVVSFTAHIHLSHDSRPPEGIKTTDITYYTGLNFRY